MRIISQNGVIDVPYENFVFSITEDNCIVSTRDSVARPSEIVKGIMAKYSTRKKSEKAMQLLHEAYTGMPVTLQNVEIPKIDDDRLKGISDCLVLAKIPNEPSKIEYINKVVFQFPKEEDL